MVREPYQMIEKLMPAWPDLENEDVPTHVNREDLSDTHDVRWTAISVISCLISR